MLKKRMWVVRGIKSGMCGTYAYCEAENNKLYKMFLWATYASWAHYRVYIRGIDNHYWQITYLQKYSPHIVLIQASTKKEIHITYNHGNTPKTYCSMYMLNMFYLHRWILLWGSCCSLSPMLHTPLPNASQYWLGKHISRCGVWMARIAHAQHVCTKNAFVVHGI
jgi:hypothetical protein